MKINDETILWANNEMLRIKLQSSTAEQALNGLFDTVKAANPNLCNWINDFVGSLGQGFVFGFAIAMRMIEVQELCDAQKKARNEIEELNNLYKRDK